MANFSALVCTDTGWQQFSLTVLYLTRERHFERSEIEDLRALAPQVTDKATIC